MSSSLITDMASARLPAASFPKRPLKSSEDGSLLPRTLFTTSEKLSSGLLAAFSFR
jgi:hypothetical protein